MNKKYSKPEFEVCAIDILQDVLTASKPGSGDSVDATSGGFYDGEMWGVK